MENRERLPEVHQRVTIIEGGLYAMAATLRLIAEKFPQEFRDLQNVDAAVVPQVQPTQAAPSLAPSTQQANMVDLEAYRRQQEAYAKLDDIDRENQQKRPA